MSDNRTIFKKAADAVYPVVRYIRYKKNTHSVSPVDLFHLQNKDGLFVHPDFIIRYLFIEEYFGKNTSDTNGIDLYKKMQDFRRKDSNGDEMTERFINVIQSYQQNGHLTAHPIRVDRSFLIRDGSHRTAAALYLDLPEITVHHTKIDLPVNRKLAVFEENGFTAEELQLVNDKTQQLLDKYNHPLNIILLGPAAEYAEDVKNQLSSFGQVISCESVKCSVSDLFKLHTNITGTDNKNFSIHKPSLKPYRKEYATIRIIVKNPEVVIDSNHPKPVLKQSALIKDCICGIIGDKINASGQFVYVPSNYGQNDKIFGFISQLHK